MRLGDFIKTAAGWPFGWEYYGCARLPAEWAGAGSLAGLPACTTEAEVAAVIDDAGGLVALFDRQLTGIASRGDPAPGAIGVSRMPDGIEMAGVLSDERWIFLTPHGIRAMHVPHSRALATWRLHG